MQLTNSSIDYIDAHKGTPYYEQTPEEARAIRQMNREQNIDVEGISSIQDVTIPVRDYHISARVYKPHGAGPFPVILYFHGGGWVFGSPESADGGCRYLTAETKQIVISVDYRLAPEYPFPTPLNDAFDALQWVIKEAKTLHIQTNAITLSGDSAGGNLAAALAILVAKHEIPLHALALIYPVLNADLTEASYDAYGQHLGLDTRGMEWFLNHYVPDATQRKNPYVAPLHYEHIEQFPPTLLIAAQYDVLVDEGITFMKRLNEASPVHERIEMPGLIHSYYSKMAFFEEETKQTTIHISKFLKKLK